MSDSLKNYRQPALMFNMEATGQYEVIRHQKDFVATVTDVIAEEVPIAFVYNGVSHAVMLATPQDLEDFALGFSLSEGILDTSEDLYGMEIVHQAQGIELQLDVASACFQRLKEKRRSMTGRTGCGLCGSESLDLALRIPNAQLQNRSTLAKKIGSKVIHLALTNVLQKQSLQKLTGATHASAWIGVDGVVEVLREDVGRHNALDKLIGALVRNKQNEDGFIMTTSRASYEMVQKTVSAGVNILVAISAPTGLAVRVAEQCHLTLIGFTRENSYVVYSHPENLES